MNWTNGAISAIWQICNVQGFIKKIVLDHLKFFLYQSPNASLTHQQGGIESVF